MVWRWRNVHDLWIDIHGLRRPTRCEYVRSRPETTRLARGCDEDTRSQGETGEEGEEHHQSGGKATEELSAQTEKLVDFSSCQAVSLTGSDSHRKAIREIYS